MANQKLKLVTIVCEPVLLTSLVATIRLLGATGFTISEVRGEGSGDKNSGEVPNEKVKIEVVLADEMLDKALEAIQKAAKTGRIGDGKIFVSTIEEAIRIRTGETGSDAI